MEESQVTSDVAPGWYPDPAGGPEQRYWDGQQWLIPPTSTGAHSARGKRKRRWWIIGGAAVVAAALAIALPLTLTGGGGDKLTGYGKKAVDVARALHTCVRIEHTSKDGSVTRCVSAAGDYIAIVASPDETTQDFMIAMMKDDSDGDCHVVTPGVVFSAQTETELIGVLGVPESYAAKHHGYMLC